MTNVDSILKSRYITLSTKARLVKAMLFQWTCMDMDESQTIKKAEHQRINAFKLWFWRRLLRVPWTARRQGQAPPPPLRRSCSLSPQQQLNLAQTQATTLAHAEAQHLLVTIAPKPRLIKTPSFLCQVRPPFRLKPFFALGNLRARRSLLYLFNPQVFSVPSFPELLGAVGCRRP